MIIYLLIIFLIFFIYFITFQYFLSGWNELPEYAPGYFKGITVTVIIPIRNEEDRIREILHDLLNQDYSFSYYKIVVVDDHSEDSGYFIATEEAEKSKIISVFKLNENEYGKKAAINKGIQNSDSELIITTDADCRIGKSWLSGIITYYIREKKPVLLIGLVDYKEGKNIFSKFQNIDFLSMVLSGIAATGKNIPFLCNGANLAYQRKVYESISDPLKNNISSGDDLFLLEKLKKKYRKQIVAMKSMDALVFSEPALSIGQFLNQRLRWASKSKYFKDIHMIYVSVLVFVVNTIVLGNYFLAGFNVSWYPLIISFTMKTASDLLFLYSTLKFLKKRKLLIYLIPFQIIYPIYIVFSAVLGMFARSEWKKRKIER